MRHFLSISTLILLVCAGLMATAQAAGAQTGSAADLLAQVNALRAASSLLPFQIDANLMASAQAHSDYQASIGQATHTRADGSGPAGYGFIENIASGYGLDAQTAVTTLWADAAHTETMLGISEGYAGAGAAVKDGVVYFTLQVRRSPGAEYIAPQIQPAAAIQANDTPTPGQAVPGFQTQAPQPDGSIVHVVQEGESLWSIAIAYAISMNELIAQNNLAPTPVIFPSQELLIRAAFTPTVSPTVTRTPRPPTRTPTLKPTPRAPTAIPTLAPTPTPTPFSLLNALPELPANSQRPLGIGMIVVCGAGLLAVLVASFRKK